MVAKESTAKSRYLIAILLLVASLIAITGALVGVYAASLQVMGTKFQIQYNSDNLAVKVWAKYQIKDETAVDLGMVEFKANSSENSQKLGSEDYIILSGEQTYVDFTYTFQNLSSTEWVNISSSWLNYTSDVSNITASYVISTSQVGDETQIQNADSFNAMAFQLSSNATYSIRIRFTVNSGATQAYVTSSETNGLTFNMQHTNPVV